MYKIKEIKNFEELVALKNIWDDLIKTSGKAHLFLSHEWIIVQVKNINPRDRLSVLLIYKDREVIGIAPLVLSRATIKGLYGKVIQFIGDPFSDYGDFIIKDNREKVIDEIFNYLLNQAENWDFIDLKEIPEDSPHLKIIENVAKKYSLKNFRTISSVCPYITVNKSWEDFWEKTSRNLKKDLKRKMNKAEKIGEINYGQIKEIRQNEKLLKEFFEMHIKKWLDTDTPSRFENLEFRNLWKDLALNTANDGHFLMSILNLNQKTIASEFGFIYDKKYYSYNLTYDPDYAAISPGNILRKYYIQWCFKQGLEEIDFLRGEEEWKFRWTEEKRNNFREVIIHPGLKSRFIYFYFKSLKRFFFSLRGKLRRNNILIKNLLVRLKSFTFAKYEVIIHHLDLEQFSPQQTAPNNTSFKEATLDGLLVFYKGETDLMKRAEKRLQEGKKCFLGFFQDKPVSMAWLSFSDEYESYLEKMIEVGNNEGCIFDIVTEKDFRGLGISPFLQIYALKFLKEHQIKTALTAIAAGNHPSLRAAEKAGFVPYKLVTRYRILGQWLDLEKKLKD